MNEKRFELRLCNNGTYYLWNNSELTDIGFDKFNKESANELVDLLNELHEENQALKSDRARYEEECRLDVFKELFEENEQLKQDNTGLMHLLENQSIIIQELHSKLMSYQLKEPITLTKEDLEVMGKAISYYTH